MEDSLKLARDIVMYRIDKASQAGRDQVVYHIGADVPAPLLRGVSGMLANQLRKLGYRVAFLDKEKMRISWNG